MESLLDRITMDENICHGKPCVRHMRFPVELIVDLLSSGMTSDQILEDYPSLESDDIKACLMYASRVLKVKSIHKLRA